MAIGTTNISTNVVKTALAVTSDNVFVLCTSSAINKWSRYKPIRDAGAGSSWPSGSDAKYGLDLSNNWGYLQPRGGSPGGSPDEPGRLGDFRGYEHDRDLTGPVIYCLASDITIAATITPTLADNVATGQWFHKANLTPHNSVKILPSDMGLSGYYCGIHLSIGTNSYYKTGALVSAISTGGQVIYFDARVTDLEAKTFEDFPSGEAGTFTWRLFISSSQHTAWTQTTPTNYIQLPGSATTGATETWGNKTIKSSGTFIMKPWLIPASTYNGSTQVTQLTWAYNNADVKSVYLRRTTGSTYPGPNSIPSHWSIVKAYQINSSGTVGNDVTTNYAAWDDRTRVDLQPTGVNGGSQISGNAIFGFMISTSPYVFGDEATVNLVHEVGTPPSATWTSTQYTLTTKTINSGLSIGSTSLNITFGMNPNTPSGNIPVQVSRGGSQIGSTTIYKVTGSDATGSITVSSLAAGDIIIINIGNAG